MRVELQKMLKKQTLLTLCFVHCLFIPGSYTAHTVPQLTKQPENAFGKEGKPLTLKCRGTSQPPPSFSWYLNNKEITADQTMFTRTVEGDLTISSFNSLEHAGTYNCLMRVVDVRDPSTDQDDLELKLRSRDAVVKAYGE